MLRRTLSSSVIIGSASLTPASIRFWQLSNQSTPRKSNPASCVSPMARRPRNTCQVRRYSSRPSGPYHEPSSSWSQSDNGLPLWNRALFRVEIDVAEKLGVRAVRSLQVDRESRCVREGMFFEANASSLPCRRRPTAVAALKAELPGIARLKRHRALLIIGFGKRSAINTIAVSSVSVNKRCYIRKPPLASGWGLLTVQSPPGALPCPPPAGRLF